MPTVRTLKIGATAVAFVLALAGGCRLLPSSRPLDRKTARKLVREVTVDTPWIRIPAGLPDASKRDAKAAQAYRRLAKAGILQCADDLTNCKVGPRGKDLTYEGESVGLKVTIGFLVADDISVIRLADQNSASATVTVRFQPAAVFTGFRRDLVAILEAHGDAFAADQISGGHMAKALFHRAGNVWRLEDIALLERTGAASRRAAVRDPELAAPATVNLAQSASVLVSSEDTSSGRTGLKAIDGLVDETPDSPGAEWVARSEREGAWIKLTWSAPVKTWEIVLHDLPDPNDNIRSGLLAFSDGSQMMVGQLPEDGSPLRLEFDPKLISWLEFRVTSAVGSHAGLSEIEVIGTPASR
jgi:hypothetical protein